MKRLLAIALTLLSFGSLAIAEASSASTTAKNAYAPQIRIQIGQNRGRHRRWRNRNNRRSARTYVQTRYVRRGYATFRETYQVTQWPNGRMSTTLISRQRVS